MMKKLFVLLSVVFTISFADAQEQPGSTVRKDTVHLDQRQMQALCGVFQSVGNKDRYVEFFVRDGGLVAKLLWNSAELHFIPESELAFNSREAEEGGSIHIVFRKDSTGTAGEVNVEKIGLWRRAKDYKPIVRKEMPHTPADLKPMEGLYCLDRSQDRFIRLTVDNNRLILQQTWDGEKIFFLPESPLSFYSPVIPAFTLDFTRDMDGYVSSVLAFKHDKWIKTKKIDLPLSSLKKYEGKYQSKGDPDNQVQITAGANSLVVKQLWDGKEFVVVPWNENYFYDDAQAFPLLIVQDKDGQFQGIKLLDENLFTRVSQ